MQGLSSGIVDPERALAAARYMIESVDEIKRDLSGLFRKFRRAYVVKFILLRWK